MGFKTEYRKNIHTINQKHADKLVRKALSRTPGLATWVVVEVVGEDMMSILLNDGWEVMAMSGRNYIQGQNHYTMKKLTAQVVLDIQAAEAVK